MKRKLNFLRLSLFNHYLAGLYLSSGSRTKDPLRKTYFRILSTNLVLKIQPVDRPFFCKSKEHFLHAIYTKHLLSQRTLSHVREFKIYPSNLRRHKKDKNNRTNFTYVRVNLIFQRLACITKTSNGAYEGKQIRQ